MSNSKVHKIPFMQDYRLHSKIAVGLLFLMFFFPWFSNAGFPYYNGRDTLSGMNLVIVSSRIVSGAFVVFLPLIPLVALTIMTLIEEEFAVLRKFSAIGFVVSVAFAVYIAFRSPLPFGEWIGNLWFSYYAIIIIYAFLTYVCHRGTKADEVF